MAATGTFRGCQESLGFSDMSGCLSEWAWAIWKYELHVLVPTKQKAGMLRSASWNSLCLHIDNEFLHVVGLDGVTS